MEKIYYRNYAEKNCKIDIEKLKEDFDEAFEFFGKTGSATPGYKFLLGYYHQYYDAFGDFRNVLIAFCKARGDIDGRYFTGQEAAAFVAALGKQIL